MNTEYIWRPQHKGRCLFPLQLSCHCLAIVWKKVCRTKARGNRRPRPRHDGHAGDSKPVDSAPITEAMSHSTASPRWPTGAHTRSQGTGAAAAMQGRTIWTCRMGLGMPDNSQSSWTGDGRGELPTLAGVVSRHSRLVLIHCPSLGEGGRGASCDCGTSWAELPSHRLVVGSAS